ncbi:ABC transporter substrate-binding protein [Limnochorda pilosa]|uniref:Ethanolamine utilization protein EutJ n=1 Tax=Limnochorda pilosa TaxID=1555112 RepID=A0A0K2SN57_LIMPI|nr:ABC transporter substrate-binding protein [Limnochorda pilosa]BAS28546.1 ethanolamine utilization protein EutJ [Limnochorda pilosa]
MRRSPGLFVLAALVLAWMAGPSSAQAQEIVVGLNAELTGSIPVVGQSSRNAALMAVDEVNAQGGLLVGGARHRIRLLVEDNHDDPAAAAAVAQKLIYQDQVVAMVGPNASRDAIPAATIAESARTPMISPWSTNPQTTAGKSYVFRACFTDDFQGQVVAGFVYRDLGLRRAAVLYDVASDYNKGIAEIFRSSFTKLGGQVVAFETYTTGDRDFSSQITRIVSLNPDVLFLPNYYSEVPLQVQQARNLGYEGPIIGSDSWGSTEIVALGGAVMNDQFFTTHYAPDIATPEARAFIEGYEERYGSTPDDVAALTYDAFGMLFHAIQQAGSWEREAIRQALAQISQFTGVTGTMSFHGTGDPEKSAVVIRIQDGQFRYYGAASP